MDINEKKIFFVELDCLITVENPHHMWDLKLETQVWSKLKNFNPLAILIVSNQSEVPAKVAPILFQQKLMYVVASLQQYVGFQTLVAAQYAPTLPEEEKPFSLPDTTMLVQMYNEYMQHTRTDVKKSECVMISLHAETRDAAHNFECDCLALHEFLTSEVTGDKWKVVNCKDGSTHFNPNNQAIMISIPYEFAAHYCDKVNKGLPEPLVAVVPRLWTMPKPMEHRKFKVDASKLNSKGKGVKMKIEKGGK